VLGNSLTHSQEEIDSMEFLNKHSFDTNEYKFKELLESYFGCRLEKLHEHIDLPKILPPDHTIWDDAYKFIVNDKEFLDTWYSFIENVIKPILGENTIVLQKLPSIKFHPPKTTYQYLLKKSNWHRDGESPYLHPKFESNLWMPLMDVDKHNTMYCLHEGEKKPQLLKYGEILHFSGNTMYHGSNEYSNSEQTRVSLDFRGCKFSDYNVDLMKPVPIYSHFTKDKPKLQNEWFTIGKYYEKF
tara:strand:+ start:1161 stop:1886 length:726 start_codon:yes stop_codon:yes gene_type:complete